jgi:hypothetical protein
MRHRSGRRIPGILISRTSQRLTSVLCPLVNVHVNCRPQLGYVDDMVESIEPGG